METIKRPTDEELYNALKTISYECSFSGDCEGCRLNQKEGKLGCVRMLLPVTYPMSNFWKAYEISSKLVEPRTKPETDEDCCSNCSENGKCETQTGLMLSGVGLSVCSAFKKKKTFNEIVTEFIQGKHKEE